MFREDHDAAARLQKLHRAAEGGDQPRVVVDGNRVGVGEEQQRKGRDDVAYAFVKEIKDGRYENKTEKTKKVCAHIKALRELLLINNLSNDGLRKELSTVFPDLGKKSLFSNVMGEVSRQEIDMAKTVYTAYRPHK